MEISSVSAPTMSYEDIMKPLKVLKEHEVTISSLERLLGEMVPHCLQVAKERGDGSFPEIEQLWRRLLFESLQLLPESDRVCCFFPGFFLLVVMLRVSRLPRIVFLSP